MALAIVANGDEDAVARLRARGLLLNVVDRPDLCDFTLPAIIDRDPVLIAIGTGGASAGLGGLASALFAARDSLRARFPDTDVRRRAIGSLLAADGPLDPLTEHPDPASAIAASEAAPGRTERLEIVSADPDALTLRAARLLGLADRLHIEGAVPDAILDRARADAQRIAGACPRVPAPGLTLHLIWKPE